MVWLVLGLVLWSLAHAFPSLAAEQRSALIARLGEGPYKGLFALVVVGAVALMVIGWRATAPVALYVPPPGAGTSAVAGALVLVAFLMFPAGRLKSNLRRAIRHPQLTAVALWAVAHLIANGEGRSVVLFGGLGLWALVEMVLINRRQGAWVRPEPVPLKAEVKPLGAGLVLFVVFLLLHPWLFGVSPFGG